MPAFDAIRIEHCVVAAGIEEAYEATLKADFIEAWKTSHAVRALFTLRSAAERVASLLGVARKTEPVSEPESMRLMDLTTTGEWVVLARNPPREICFGAVGRFWGGETSWETIKANEFESFHRPGFARIASSFVLSPLGSDRTLITYETRTQGTEADATRGFIRYWKIVSPFVGVVLRAMLGVIEREVAAGRSSDDEVAGRQTAKRGHDADHGACR